MVLVTTKWYFCCDIVPSHSIDSAWQFVAKNVSVISTEWRAYSMRPVITLVYISFILWNWTQSLLGSVVFKKEKTIHHQSKTVQRSSELCEV